MDTLFIYYVVFKAFQLKKKFHFLSPAFRKSTESLAKYKDIGKNSTKEGFTSQRLFVTFKIFTLQH